MRITGNDKLSTTISVSPKLKELLTKYQGKLMGTGKKVTQQMAICHAIKKAVEAEFPEDNFGINCEEEGENAKQ